MRPTTKAIATTGFIAVMMILTVSIAPAHAGPVPPPVTARTHSASMGEVAPLVAGPTGPMRRASVFPCDLLTHICVKNSKSETKWIAAHTSALSGGGIAGAGAVCSKLPLPFPTKAACVVVVSTAGGALADSYNGAAGKGHCVELHFSTTLLGLTHWKTEGC